MWFRSSHSQCSSCCRIWYASRKEAGKFHTGSLEPKGWRIQCQGRPAEKIVVRKIFGKIDGGNDTYLEHLRRVADSDVDIVLVYKINILIPIRTLHTYCTHTILFVCPYNFVYHGWFGRIYLSIHVVVHFHGMGAKMVLERLERAVKPVSREPEIVIFSVSFYWIG